MESGQYLKFLRPYLFQSPSSRTARTAIYSRLFSASRRKPARHGHPRCWAFQSASCKAFHTSPSKRSADSDTDAPAVEKAIEPATEPSIDATAWTSRHAVDKRILKLKQSDALHYPRLRSQPERMTLPNFKAKYQNEKDFGNAEEVVLEGRISSIRRSGPKLIFITLTSLHREVQVMVNMNRLSDPKPDAKKFGRIMRPLLRGDIVSVKGKPSRSETDALTLQATELPDLLSPCVAPLPDTLTNQETMVLNRHVHLLVDDKAFDRIRLRSFVVKCMRDFFSDLRYLEVQTPVLAETASGAVARPFVTSSIDISEKKLALRIAPELWLKRLIVGGLERVYEIGPVFRNEGIDTTHNPEFTMCESYCSYANLDDLIEMTEALISRIFRDTKKLIYHELGALEMPDIEVPEKDWKQIEFIPALEEILGFKFPDLSAPDALPKILELLESVPEFTPGENATLPKLLDELANQYLEKDSAKQPLFIMHHPACMSPLSKSFKCPKTDQLVSARAELFIGCREIANMYEEENSPFEQRRKFELQLEAKNDSAVPDDEGPSEVDESYVRALEYGLPPTAGWGCGVDRLVMLLSGAPRIGDVLSFGNLRNVASINHAIKDH